MADSQDAVQGESVDRIRDIIFGPKMRDYEQRFEALVRYPAPHPARRPSRMNWKRSGTSYLPRNGRVLPGWRPRLPNWMRVPATGTR